MTKPLRILLTEGSSTSARQTLHCLGGQHILDVMDSSALGQGRFSRHVRHWHRCPLSSRQPIEYLRRMVGLIDEHQYDVLIATHEQAFLLARVRDALGRRVAVALPTFEAINRLQDKANFARVMSELGLPQPETRCIADSDAATFREECLSQTQFPCFVKAAHGTAGRGVVHVEDLSQMQKYVDDAFGMDQEIVIQSAAPGELSILQAVFDRGRLVAWHDAMALRRGVGGAPIVRISTHREQVAADVEKLGAALDWHGALFVEYFYDEVTGKHQFIEANPRIGETVNAMLAGVNLCEKLVDVSLGRATSQCVSGTSGVRSHQFLTALLDRAMQTGSRRAVAKEILDRLRLVDGYRDTEPELMRWRSDPFCLIPPLAVAAQLLISPRGSHKMVASTVANYGLDARAVTQIAAIPIAELDAIFDVASGESPAPT